MDNYYKGLPPGVDASVYNWDHPEALDMDLLAAHLRALHSGEDISVPHYDFTEHKRRVPALNSSNEDCTFISASETDVVILDGIFVLAVPPVRAACDLTLFTLEDLDICLARRLRRDISERGRSVDGVLEQYCRFVKPGFHNFIQPSMNFAGECVFSCFNMIPFLPRYSTFWHTKTTFFSSPPPPNPTDILVPRARENLVAIEMVASEVARRVETETVRAAAGVAPTPRPIMNEE